jgi:hypothetical protein
MSGLPYGIQVEGVAHAQENRPLVTHVFSSPNLPMRCKCGLGRLPFISMLSRDLGRILMLHLSQCLAETLGAF